MIVTQAAMTCNGSVVEFGDFTVPRCVFGDDRKLCRWSGSVVSPAALAMIGVILYANQPKEIVAMLDDRVIVTVEGGVVEGVIGVPHGWVVETRDRDIALPDFVFARDGDPFRLGRSIGE